MQSSHSLLKRVVIAVVALMGATILAVLSAAPRAIAHVAPGTGSVLIRLSGAKVSHSGMPLDIRVFRTLLEPRTCALYAEDESSPGFPVLFLIPAMVC